MGEGLIIRGGNAVNSDLTATPTDVLTGGKFYGAGSDEIQTGSIEDNGTITHKLPVNSTYTIPAGYHQNGEVYQDIQIIDGNVTVSPTAQGTSAGLKGKFFNSDVIVSGIENLIPENIKAGAFVGTVEGTWQGFVNGDPLQPYWYGLFAPGQTGRLIYNRNPTGSDLTEVSWSNDDPETGGKNLSFRSLGYSGHVTSRNYPAIRFENPIEMDGVTSITVEYILPDHSAGDYTWLILGENPVNQITNDNSWDIDPAIGAHEIHLIPYKNTYGTHTFSISNAHLYHYVYFGIGVAQGSTQGRFMFIRSIKLNK